MFQERDLELPFKLEHEKQRVNQLIWMQDVGIGKHVWSWWPLFKKKKLLSIHQLMRIMPNINQGTAEQYIEAINETLITFDITIPLRIAHFLAQVSHETSDLKYSEEIASGSLYEGRNDLGNVMNGDGKKFKGRGLLQLTGRKNYTAFENFMNGNSKTITYDFTNSNDSAKELSNNIRFSCLASGYYWKFIRPKLNEAADRDDIFWVSVYVNGWAKQEHPFYPDKAREPNHMKKRYIASERAKIVLGVIYE